MLQITSSQFIRPKAEEITGDDACDYVLIDDALLVAVLCDGVGGARHGGEAARQTVKYLLKQFQNRPQSWDIPQTITIFTQHINRMLFKESMTQYERIEYLTTLCIAVVEGPTLYTMNLGDSRIYLQHDNGPLQQLSTDQTMDEENLSHVLTQACGLNEHVTPKIRTTAISEGDRIILCSDGVSNIVSDDLLAEKAASGLGAKVIINSITNDYKDYHRDDASLQIFKIEKRDSRYALRHAELPIPETLAAGDRFDDIELLEPMMPHGRIWKAKCHSDGTTVVIKFPMSDDPEAIDKFATEAWYAGQITHKAFGHAWIPENRTVRYYLMELVEGTNLKAFIKDKHLSVDSAILLAKFLHKVEAHLLNLGLVHGDIKPENIIVYREKDTMGTRFKMIDFGSVVRIFSENSRAGTPSYLAPERFTGHAINESTEIFSIGVTIYWALTGKYPYGEIEPFQNPVFKQAYPPSKYNANIPFWLDSVILRAVAITADERYEHYSELFYELQKPENVRPFYPKDSSKLDRVPKTFYKMVFFLMLILEIITLLHYQGY
ncbi:bifunctional protein-serine/threonine kinase/phosphatase [Sulfurimonas sp. HSL3-7]|uniref:bifunctional protein-serine/threonine kinase/phosphatase n=1 Tax=Sulfonitrofixus jiaomeiensis TaxID=3131938 RepID=UPI0031F9FF31